ncbi:MAG: hypothetical protein MUE97_05340 [Phycisphaerales bacterium]|jgi:hypothetical protein|nr:hypothetical protein [Phycisphaerales bacterium]
MKNALAIGALLVSAGVSVASAQVVAQWRFNGSIAGLNSSNPAATVGPAGSAASLSNTSLTAGFNTGSPLDTDASNNGWNTTTYPAIGAASGTAGPQFFVPTTGLSGPLSVTFEQRASNSASRFIQFQYTLDGTSFITTSLANDGVFEATLGGDVWYSRSVDLSAIAGVANNANFGFRMVTIFAPGGTQYARATPPTGTQTYQPNGTMRYDLVTVVPTPAAAALLGLGGLVATRRRR